MSEVVHVAETPICHDDDTLLDAGMLSAAHTELSSDQSPGVGTNGVTRVISTPTLPHTHC